MKRSTKAALFSALVLPGLGHLYLKKYLLGAALSLVTLGVLYVLASYALTQAMAVSDMIVNGKVALDVTAIQAALDEQSSPSQQRLMGLLGYVFVVLWIGGLLDAYRQGRNQALEQTETVLREESTAGEDGADN